MPHNKEGGSNIGYKTIMAIPELTWDDISHDMAEYIKPKLESLFPYHQYTYRETNKGK
ncbi:hypothetical protein KA037_04335 [Patescibacteria group bacterium]|nr:hypothetical protein [Patescibacteria group bacterium]